MASNYFGFTESPFELTPDSKFLFPTPGFEAASEAVLEGIRSRRGLIVLIGEVGTGKTLLLHTIIRRLPEGTPSAFLFHSTFTYQELIREILHEFGVNQADEEDPESRLQAYLQGLRHQEKTAVVCIDEAHKLNESVGRKLIAFLEKESWIPKVFQCVLSGQPELESAFRGPLEKFGLRHPPLPVRLHPFSREESRAYIEHRLRIAGRRATDIFSESALELIVAESGGIPRRINTLCDNAFFTAQKNLAARIDLPILQEVLQQLEGPARLSAKISRGLASTHRLFPSSLPSFRKGIWLLWILIVGLGIFWAGWDLPLPFRNGRWEEGLNRSGRIVRSLWTKPLELFGGKTIPPAPPAVKPIEPLPDREARPAPSPPASSEKVRVQKGEHLSGLILRAYGKYHPFLVDRVLQYNPSIRDLNLILTGQTIHLPKWNAEGLIAADPGGAYRIHLGTYGTSQEAETQKKKVRPFVLFPRVVPRKIDPRTTWYRLESGPYPSREEARKVISRLQNVRLLPAF